ncbi:MAG: hypothetical protein GQ567_04625 [Methanosarcinales archaeon]|nr:hypothetical protein [Methanosarcinales archaeon]
MTTKTTKILLERHTAKLSFAVSLIDDYSGDASIGRIDVRLKGRDKKPVKNPSSYYTFLNLPDDTYTVRVRSDHYFDEDSGIIEPAKLDPIEPVVEMILKPKPTYPFPPGATLIRGMVRDSAGKAVSGARVMVREMCVESSTTEKGEFVLYFGSLTEDEIVREDGKMFLKGDNNCKIIHLEAEYSGLTKTTELQVKEGGTTSVIIQW